MSLIDETRNLERRNFFASQRLLDVDLNDREAFHREMRWLHNRSLHQPGVGNGYQILGAKGDRSVTIGPGYAIDANGREIVLNRSVDEPIPPVAGEDNGTLPSFFYLAVSYPDDSRLDEAEVRLGTCGTRGAVRLSERPLICWIPLTVDKTSGAGVLVPADADLRRDVNAGMLIVLAIVEVFQCRLNRDITEKSFLPRRSARPPRLPYTASAVEVKPDWVAELITGLTAPVLPPPSMAPAFFRLKATVKTVVATFGAIPRYLARVSDSAESPFVFDTDVGLGPPSASKAKVYVEPRLDVVLDDKFTDHTKLTVSVSLLVYPADPASTFFTATSDQLVAIAGKFADRWSIVWIGIEG
jgi:hypothetical protein